MISEVRRDEQAAGARQVNGLNLYMVNRPDGQSHAEARCPCRKRLGPDSLVLWSVDEQKTEQVLVCSPSCGDRLRRSNLVKDWREATIVQWIASVAGCIGVENEVAEHIDNYKLKNYREQLASWRFTASEAKRKDDDAETQ